MVSKRKTTATIGEIQSDLHAVQEDVVKLADHLTELLSDKGENVVDEVRQRVNQLRESIDTTISDVGAGTRRVVRDGKDGLQDVTDALADSVRDRPFTTLALAIGLGVIVGSTLRR
jgi:ElaB/YqjD/DUF883 family membrane-anchored ribosome-binding protein